MIEKLKDICWDWRYVDEYNPAGWLAFWEAVRFWWQHRPRLAECSAGCGTVIWKNGSTDQARYCSEGCAYYGSGYWVSLEEDEIPF